MRIHGINIRKVDHDGFIPQVLQGAVHQVKMDAFHQQVGGDNREEVAVVDHGGVIANSFERGRIAQREILSQMIDQAELAEFVNVRAFGWLFLVMVWHAWVVVSCQLLAVGCE